MNPVQTRWNGWGDSATDFPLSQPAKEFLEAALGNLTPQHNTTLEEALKRIPPSRLETLGIETGEKERLTHARGQSFPDWVALRSGEGLVFPDAVMHPQKKEQVQEILILAAKSGAKIIPFGGGTSVVGHINPPEDGPPTICVDLRKLNRLLELDKKSRLARFEAGVRGPDLESQLKAEGFTLGHYPQSFEFSTLGGWIATRSSGQQSYYYGRIEDLFAGGEVETPRGRLDFRSLPASAAGPDLRQLFLGSEGRLGILTQAEVRVRPCPEVDGFYGVFFPNWEAGVSAVRECVQADIRLSMLRLSNPVETQTTLMLSGKDRLVKWAERGLAALGYTAQRCLLIYGVTGSLAHTQAHRQEAEGIFRKMGGLCVGSLPGKLWQKSRFKMPYLRNTLWDMGIGIDTIETAAPWRAVEPIARLILRTITDEFARLGEQALVFNHLSHVYRDGASIYTTLVFRLATSPEETLERWQAVKRAASQLILNQGGTISHQHGAGVDHLPYLEIEKGEIGMNALRNAAAAVDPEGMMNPGKLFSWRG